MAIFVLWCALLAGDPNAYVVYHPSTGMLENVNLQGLYSTYFRTFPRDTTSLSAFAARVQQLVQSPAFPKRPQTQAVTQLEAFQWCIAVAKQT
jgi:LPS O-antigen subunit length determinant protein (WzzB/FepE family)